MVDCKQSKGFLESTEDRLLTHVTHEINYKGHLSLLLTSKEKTVRDAIIKGSFGCSDQVTIGI